MSPRTIQLLGIAAGKGARTPGAEDGPYALRDSGLIERLAGLGHRLEDLGNIPGVYETRFSTAPSQNVRNFANVLQVIRHTHVCVLGTRRRNPDDFLLIVGGDHSLAIGTLAGLADACERLGLIWIDAHADFNTPKSSPSGNVHGMSLAVACGRGHRDLIHVAHRQPMIDEADVQLFGCRDLDPGEQRALKSSRVNLLTCDEFRKRGVGSAIEEAARDLGRRCDHVHLSFDIDALDPAFVPGTGTPVADGLSPEECGQALDALAGPGTIASAEFVEYNPALDPSGATAELMLTLIERLLGKAKAP
jgi:arginase